ncbi:WDR73 protein, partial [Turnix velox]|nr:WDR73 protein [Turnix velox]
SLLVTSGPPDSSIQVWKVSPEDSDVIKPLSVISPEDNLGQAWAKIATTSTRASCVLHGTRLDSVHLTEVESMKNIYRAASRNHEDLSGLTFLDSNNLLLCSTKGHLSMGDIRSPLEVISIPS